MNIVDETSLRSLRATDLEENIVLVGQINLFEAVLFTLRYVTLREGTTWLVSLSSPVGAAFMLAGSVFKALEGRHYANCTFVT